MHEMSLAVSLLEHVVAEAARGGLRNVSELSIELGALQSVEPDLLADAFRAAALGGLAEGARLDLRVREAEALCRACGHTFHPTYQCYVCPQCGRADVEILQGRDLLLLSLSGEAVEGPAADTGQG